MGDAIIKKYFACEEWEKEMDCRTRELKRMQDYTGLNFNELMALPLSAFLYLRKESWVHSFLVSETGRETLKDIWRLSQTKADMTAVRRHSKVVVH